MMTNIYVDPLLGGNQYSQQNIAAQKEYLNRLEELQRAQGTTQPTSANPIWDKIDEELGALTDMQKEALFKNEDYIEVNSKVNELFQTKILELIKPYVEQSKEGKEALEQQLSVVKKLKKNVVEETSREIEELRKWKEYSSKNPTATYSDFVALFK